MTSICRQMFFFSLTMSKISGKRVYSTTSLILRIILHPSVCHRMTDIQLELIHDVDMCQFVEKGTRGGISYIAYRQGQANNKYMENYDKSNRSKYITYLDANNLYGWAMSQYLPTGNLKWLTDKQIKQLDINDFKHDINNGMILEVHLQYPEELHDLHNDYPLASEKIKVTENM